MVVNSLGREIPEVVGGKKIQPFRGITRKYTQRKVIDFSKDTTCSKVLGSLKETLKKVDLQNGMTISFHLRKGEWQERTTDIFKNYAQFNLVVVPKENAFDFLLFCLRNPQACPVVDITDVGNTEPKLISSSADLRTDLPKYRVFKNGELVVEPVDIIKYWNKDLVAFLLGTAMGVLETLKNMHIPWRNFGGYKTSIPCSSAGRFKSHLVVTAIAFKNSNDAVKAIQISSRFPAMHGAPIHIGSPESIGIKDLKKPDTFIPKGEIEPLHPEEILIYWGCGVTPQVAALESKVPFIITHSPGHFLVSDKLVEEFSIL